MEFSAKDLEDIQRVAGLLNLTVDELIQQRRASISIRAAAQRFPTHRVASPSDTPVLSPPQEPNDQNNPFAWQHVHVYRHHESLDIDSIEADEYSTQASASVASGSVHERGTEVILLNPGTAWYDCDAGLWNYGEPSGTDLANDDGSALEADEGESFTQVTPMHLDTDRYAESAESTPREAKVEVDQDAAGTDWALVSSSPGSNSSFTFKTPTSPTTGSVDKRYHLIAPKTARPASHSVAQASVAKVRKKRSPYHGAKKRDTHLTRQQKTVRMSRLPCLRYMVTDSTLFRTGLDYMPFYKSHPMIGPHHGDFHLQRQWTDSPSKTLCLGQLQGPLSFQVELKEFVPPVSSDVDLKGRPMYAVPWAVADPDAVVVAMNNYMDRGITQYMYEYLDDTNSLVWDIFQQAYRASVFPIPNRMLQKTLRLWVACRFIESKWRCWADSGWQDSELLNANPKDPFYDWDSLPPYLDYQIASIVIHRILTPLRKDVLRELQGIFNIHSPKDWYVTFLTSFILLQNYEMQMNFQRQFASRRKAKVKYLDMPLVRATNSGAKTILAHFHYCYKGQQLFTKEFDWKAPRVRRMARLDPEQTSFMAQCRDLVVDRAPKFEAVNHSDEYHQPYWYTSQLFDPDWAPRDTLEHAPPAETPSQGSQVV
ncbi:hypothetical protein OQA88_1843 [Cercophora sp. LCS_1]